MRNGSNLPAHLAQEGLDKVDLFRLFELAAAALPDQPALAWDGGQLTYRELDAAVGGVARKLYGATKVAIFKDRSPNLAIAVLATLRVGAAYVPMDTTYPDGRLNYMLENSGADVLVCRRTLADRLAPSSGCHVLVLDEDVLTATKPASSSDDDPPRRISTPDDLAYISYTSGSTGRPKGVAMPHRSLVNLAVWQVGWSAAAEKWRTLQLMPLSIDISFQEMFTTWASGGEVVLISDDVRADPARLLNFLENERINRFFAPFVMLQELVATACQQRTFPGNLREVITLGEQLQVGQDIRHFFKTTRATLENQYGATETHVVTAERLDDNSEHWDALPSIGKAISNTTVQILGPDLKPLPRGAEGEIGISGVCVADGYIGQPELTAERFHESGDERGRIYMTGDFGRELDNGRLQYLGRRDNQIKIQGFRVEIGEVENQLRDIPEIADAVVTVHNTESAAQVLVAHCVPVIGQVVEPAKVLGALANSLAAYMVPVAVNVVHRLPFTPAGKVDRAALTSAATPLIPA